MSKLILKSISKHYGSKSALKNVNFEFKNGIYGLLGPNGAGKSTLMNIITCNIHHDSGGKIFWNDIDIKKITAEYRKKIGYMPQQQELYPQFSARRFIGYIAALKGIPESIINSEVERVIDLVDLTNDIDRKIGSFSGGMKQRVLIAQTLLGNPELLIFDEPTAGLDPKQRINLKTLISQLSNNTIILISTHIVSDIENIADNVIFVKDGTIKNNGTIADLLKENNADSLEALYMKYYGESK